MILRKDIQKDYFFSKSNIRVESGLVGVRREQVHAEILGNDSQLLPVRPLRKWDHSMTGFHLRPLTMKTDAINKKWSE